jgi:hypothetical protein
MPLERTGTPPRAALADAALKAATELGLLLKSGNDPRLNHIAHFRDVLHQTTENWLSGNAGQLTDASTARLYLHAVEQSRGSVPSSMDDFLTSMRTVVKDFDDFEQKLDNRNALQEMLNFALSLHTLLIGEAYNRVTNWKHKETF